MESAPQSLKVNHVVYTKVEEIKEANIDQTAWWVHFEGSRESLQFQGSKPFEIGDKIKITFEKVTDAKLS